MIRDVRFVIVTLCFAFPLVFVILNFSILRKETLFEWLELLAIFAAYIISTINYIRVLESVSELISHCPAEVKVKIGNWSLPILLHFLIVVLMYIAASLLLVYHASVFPFLGILSCIYAIFICSNIHVLKLAGNPDLLKAHVCAGTASTEKAYDNYLMSVLANIFFLKQENTPTFLAYLLLLAVSAGVLSAADLDDFNNYSRIQAFASGAAAVHLTISTFRFYQVINDTSELPLHRQDVLEMASRILSPKNSDQVTAAHGVCKEMFEDRRFWSARPLVLAGLLAVGAGISIWGTFLTR